MNSNIKSVCSLKSDFKFNKLLFTHNTSITTLYNMMIGNEKYIRCCLDDKPILLGAQFRHGIDSQYGEIIFIMKDKFWINKKGLLPKIDERDINGNIPTMKTNYPVFGHFFKNDFLEYTPKNSKTIDKWLYEEASKYDFRHSTNYGVHNCIGDTISWCNIQLHLSENIDLDNVEKIYVPNWLKYELIDYFKYDTNTNTNTNMDTDMDIDTDVDTDTDTSMDIDTDMDIDTIIDKKIHDKYKKKYKNIDITLLLNIINNNLPYLPNNIINKLNGKFQFYGPIGKYGNVLHYNFINIQKKLKDDPLYVSLYNDLYENIQPQKIKTARPSKNTSSNINISEIAFYDLQTLYTLDLLSLHNKIYEYSLFLIPNNIDIFNPYQNILNGIDLQKPHIALTKFTTDNGMKISNFIDSIKTYYQKTDTQQWKLSIDSNIVLSDDKKKYYFQSKSLSDILMILKSNNIDIVDNLYLHNDMGVNNDISNIANITWSFIMVGKKNMYIKYINNTEIPFKINKK